MHGSSVVRSMESRGFLTEVLGELKSRIRREHFETWFRGFRLARRRAERFEFTVPSVFARDWLRRHYTPLIEEIVRDVAGLPSCTVALNLERSKSDVEPIGALVGSGVGAVPPPTGNASGAPNGSGDPGSTGGSGTHADDAPTAAGVSPASGGGPLPPSGYARPGPKKSEYGVLNQIYTFETFVVGPCNRLSHAAALAIGDNPGRAYNPLFIHGNVGLGKTHLLQATAHAVRRKQESVRVLYLSCEDFTNRFIKSIQRGKLDEFRDFHRGVDVLVIDDIQFLANKEKTQDEFFHTFNALYNDNRQIIISSDRSPLEIPTIEERLVSRFKWGLVAEMEVPCFETRVAIVNRKARMQQVDIPDDVAYFIAERIDTNIRELEGAVTKVIGVATITEREINAELAEEALRGVALPRNKKVALPDVMGLVTGEFSISARELTGKGRTQAVSLPRQICMFLCRQHTDQSLEEIGRFFGNRDHTTVLYAVQKIKKRVKEDRMFRELIGSLSARLQQ